MGALENPIVLLILLVLVLVLFGGGKVARMGGELGTAIREFQRGLNGDEASKEETAIEEQTKQ